MQATRNTLAQTLPAGTKALYMQWRAVGVRPHSAMQYALHGMAPANHFLPWATGAGVAKAAKLYTCTAHYVVPQAVVPGAARLHWLVCYAQARKLVRNPHSSL